MFRFLLFFSGRIIVFIMFLLSSFIGKESQNKSSSLTPLERGFSTTSKIYSVFSIQMFMVLILLLIFDLEVVFIVRFVLRGGLCSLKSLAFIGFITITL